MITLISTPVCSDPDDPSILYRWVATESPINFRLFRNDWSVIASADNGAGKLQITLDAAFIGAEDDVIAVYDFNTEQMYVGTLTNIAGDPVLVTDIDWVAGMDIRYMNDNTLYQNYYFEGRVTINGIVSELTVIASPDTFGYANLDVSGVLQIATSLGKTGDYSELIMKEPTKSGNFSVEYRGKWLGGSTAYIEADDDAPIVSPPLGNTWYYGECVRSEEQGTNLHEYVPSDAQDAPFLNEFANPVYFLGLPFDLSFILPELVELSPLSDITVTLKIYNSLNTQLGGDIVTTVEADELEGYINSLNIDEATIPEGADHMTAEIELT